MTTLQTGTGEATQIQSATARRLLIERRLRGGDGLAPIPRVARDGPLPLSPGQVRLWFLDALVPGSTEWVVPIVLRALFEATTLRRLAAAVEDAVVSSVEELSDAEVDRIIGGAAG